MCANVISARIQGTSFFNCGYCAADQRLCFRTIPPLATTKVPSLWLYSPVRVGPGREALIQLLYRFSRDAAHIYLVSYICF